MKRIFVVGCPRSGTTVVQALIARHPDVHTLPETGFFEAIYGGTQARWGDPYARDARRWYHRRLHLAQSRGRRRLRELEQGTGLPRHLPAPWRDTACIRRFVRLLDRTATRAECNAWIEKTPQHLLYLDEIAAAVPDARFVHVIRAGRDVLASIADADLHQPWPDFTGGVVTWARRWNRAVDLSLARQDDPRHFLLCLEDLTRDFEGTWHALRGFLDLAADRTLLARPGSRVSSVDHEPWRKREISGRISTPERKYERLFGPETRAWIEIALCDYAHARQQISAAGAQFRADCGTGKSG